MADKFTIMFVCTGNTCRSPMAEGALRHLLKDKYGEKVKVISSGTMGSTGFPATIYGIEAAKLWDIDNSGHLSQALTKELIDKSDLIFAMSPNHYKEIVRLRSGAESKTYLFKKFPESGGKGEGVNDPIGMDLDEYNKTFLEIGEQLGKVLPEIEKLIDEKFNA